MTLHPNDIAKASAAALYDTKEPGPGTFYQSDPPLMGKSNCLSAIIATLEAAHSATVRYADLAHAIDELHSFATASVDAHDYDVEPAELDLVQFAFGGGHVTVSTSDGHATALFRVPSSTHYQGPTVTLRVEELDLFETGEADDDDRVTITSTRDSITFDTAQWTFVLPAADTTTHRRPVVTAVAVGVAAIAAYLAYRAWAHRTR
jgi:hypothetical protein